MFWYYFCLQLKIIVDLPYFSVIMNSQILKKFSQLKGTCFFVASFRKVDVTLPFLQKIILQFRFSVILIDSMFVGLLILRGEFKLWSVLGVNGFILVSLFSAYFSKCLEQFNAVSIVLIFYFFVEEKYTVYKIQKLRRFSLSVSIS